MKQKTIIMITISIMLSACSPAELFSQLAGTNVEQGTSEAIERSDAIRDKLDSIEAKKSSFPEYVELGVINPADEMVAVAFRNEYQVDQKSLFEIEAILPDPKDKYYEIWLDSPEATTPASLGVMTYQEYDNYTFSYQTQDNLDIYKTVILTKESQADDQPEERVMIGEFITEQ